MLNTRQWIVVDVKAWLLKLMSCDVSLFICFLYVVHGKQICDDMQEIKETKTLKA